MNGLAPETRYIGPGQKLWTVNRSLDFRPQTKFKPIIFVAFMHHLHELLNILLDPFSLTLCLAKSWSTADIILHLRPLLCSLFCSAELRNLFIIVPIRPWEEQSKGLKQGKLPWSTPCSTPCSAQDGNLKVKNTSSLLDFQCI